MLLAIIKWLAFVWGALALGVMCYYAVRWFPHAEDVRYNEMAMGFTMGALYGLPSWLTLPAFAVARRRELPRWQTLLLVAPVLAAFALYAAAQLLARGVL
jgi:hypothetical protein